MRRFGIAAGILVFAALAAIPSGLHAIPGAGHRPAFAAAVSALMATWWLFEAFPIGWTACLPLVLYPVLDVFGKGLLGLLRATSAGYVDPYIFLFMGGMILGAAMEQHHLHRRVALHIMRAVGTEPRRLLLGVLLATGLVSMWISNTATAVMMLPIAMALIAQLEAANGSRLKHFGCALALGVAYASNVGGIGTKIGTGTNSIFCGYVADKLHIDIGFARYVAMGTPFVMIFLPIVWALLWRIGRRDHLDARAGRDLIERELHTMGAMSFGEKKVAAVFITAAILWIASDLLRPLAFSLLPGKWQGKHYEAGVAMAAAFALLATRTISVASLKRVPWSTLVLLGGSFAMALGIEGSGLSIWLAQRMSALAQMPPILQMLLASAATVALSAVASNTATVNVLLNVLPQSLPLLGATAIASSCDFMLPAGTPPNAIVFGSGYVRLPTMMQVGFWLDVTAIVVVTLYGWLWLPIILGS